MQYGGGSSKPCPENETSLFSNITVRNLNVHRATEAYTFVASQLPCIRGLTPAHPPAIPSHNNKTETLARMHTAHKMLITSPSRTNKMTGRHHRPPSGAPHDHRSRPRERHSFEVRAQGRVHSCQPLFERARHLAQAGRQRRDLYTEHCVVYYAY